MRMKSLADAIVYAVVYINWPDRDEDCLYDDARALEEIVYCLRQATEQEKDALADAVDRALAKERSSNRPRKNLIKMYRTWMEDAFGDDEWTGNKRKKKRRGKS